MPANKTANEQMIVQIILAQPEHGFTLLLQRFKEPIYWHIRRLVVAHDDAQDVTQETFIRVFRSIHQLKEEKSLSAWIYRIATNEALRLIDKRRNTADESLEDLANEDIPTADSYIDYTDAEAILFQKAIQALPTKQRLVFSLRYYDEMTYNEIAEVAGGNALSAKSNYHFAKQFIIKYISQHG